MAASVPGSVIGETRTSLPFGKIERRNRNVERGGAGRDRICIAAAHHLDESVGIELFERALIARIKIALP